MVALSVAVVAVMGFSLSSQKIHAQSTFTPLTGKCGMLYNNSFVGFEVQKTGLSGMVANGLQYYDFDAGTSSSSRAQLSNFGLSNASMTQVVRSHTFTQAQGPLPGSVQITLETGNIINILPVNSGNTLLIQFADASNVTPGQGVCQKI